MLRVSQQEGSDVGTVGTDDGKKGMKSGWMQLRSKLCFFSMGNTGVIGQGTAPVFSLDDFGILRVFFTGLGKGEDPMEGGRGPKPTLNNTIVYIMSSLVL
jgi:hypothetical protein